MSDHPEDNPMLCQLLDVIDPERVLTPQHLRNEREFWESLLMFAGKDKDSIDEILSPYQEVLK